MSATGPEDLITRDNVVAGIQKLRFFPLALVGGNGSHLIEAGGRTLLDLSASWTASALGHGHPVVAKALARVAASPPGASILSATHSEAVGLAEELLAVVPGGGERRVHLGLSGSDVNDAALRAARHATGRPVVVAFEGGYHGGFGAGFMASGLHISAGSAPVRADVRLVPYPQPFRESDAMARSLSALENALAPGDVAVVAVEAIQCDGGLVVPPDGFLAAVAQRSRAAGALLLLDEVKVGLGRTGSMNSFDHEGVVPDLVTIGKGLGGGLPAAALIGPASVLDERRASALLTTAGNPYSCAVARAVLGHIVESDLPGRSRIAGDRLRSGLSEALADEPCVGEVRGRGLLVGVDLVTDRDTRGGDAAFARRVVYRLWQLGAIAYYVGGHVIELTPPLTISDTEIDEAIALVSRAVREAHLVDDETIAPWAGW
ncbi:putative aminotransferase protein [Janibacter sp. HTCC2649]|nr:putative aminotransferase protein [Janibacter sp. HTCC2649]